MVNGETRKRFLCRRTLPNAAAGAGAGIIPRLAPQPVRAVCRIPARRAKLAESCLQTEHRAPCHLESRNRHQHRDLFSPEDISWNRLQPYFPSLSTLEGDGFLLPDQRNALHRVK